MQIANHLSTSKFIFPFPFKFLNALHLCLCILFSLYYWPNTNPDLHLHLHLPCFSSLFYFCASCRDPPPFLQIYKSKSTAGRASLLSLLVCKLSQSSSILADLQIQIYSTQDRVQFYFLDFIYFLLNNVLNSCEAI